MASHERDQVLSAILEYAREAHNESSSRMDVDTNDAELETRLDASIKQLQDRVEEQRKVLEQVRAPTLHQLPLTPRRSRLALNA
jgi:esterase/lipase